MNCKGCNFRIFGSKNKCFKCNLDRNGLPINHSRNNQQNNNMNCNPVKNINNNDWNCKGCDFRIFGSKDKCFKCNLDRNGLAINNINDQQNNNNICTNCNKNIINSSFMHLNESHSIYCMECANDLFSSNGKCPECDKKIISVMKIYY